MEYVSGGDYRQNMEASIALTAKYIDAIKESGAYDNTAIIVRLTMAITDRGMKQTGMSG